MSLAVDIAMAVGPSLVYADQFVDIIRRKDSAGFSRDVPGVLLLANITRINFWLGEHFETALLVQSILLVMSQTAFLYVCLRFATDLEELEEGVKLAPSEAEPDMALSVRPKWKRPFNLWRWPNFGAYIDFMAAYTALLGVLLLLLHRVRVFVSFLGFAALLMEATLPIPQLVANYKRKSLAGFRSTVLLGWVGGDAFKLTYFLVKKTTWQFTICAAFQLSIDLAIVGQLLMYGRE